MSERIWNRSLLITAFAVAVVSSLSLWLAWRAAGDLAARLSAGALAVMLLAATASYSMRVLRFGYFVSRSGITLSLRDTLLVQCVGFALSVTPGHVGEVFKLHLIRERCGTPVVRTAPILLLDRFTEGGGFLLLAVASALGLPARENRYPVPSLVLIGLAAMLVFAWIVDRWGSRIEIGNTRLGQSRFWQQFVPHLENLWHGMATAFTPAQLGGGLALSTLARFADGLVVLFAAQMMGIGLTLPEAVFVLAVGGLAGGISFLPAGTGAVETTMVALLVLMGAAWTDALAATLLARLCTLWLWVAIGLVLAFVSRLPRAHEQVVGSDKT